MTRFLALVLLAFLTAAPILFAAVAVGLVCPVLLPVVAVVALRTFRRTVRLCR